MGRNLLVIALGALAATSADAACEFGKEYKVANCEAWNSLLSTFSSGAWTVCQDSVDEDPCNSNSCAKTNGWVNCKDGRLKKLTIAEDIGMAYNTSTDLANFTSAFLEIETMKFEELTIMNQTALGLDTCLDELCGTVTCDFTWSECTDTCTTDGICEPVTPSPTDAPTTASPTGAPTTASPTTDAPTPAPTDLSTFAPTSARPGCTNATDPDCITDSPTASPTSAPTDSPTSGAGALGASILAVAVSFVGAARL
ncbi:Hypothetical Protein FCC1311_009742 [Hondaea fermentalgiana]|uniref:Uncharacterized protein n=1 Tax=Hondaea fermentalgiana TaxID=2315210 RepID=A0A2R5G163_9STRA|nr:Hypothetical Protein FCC1311_009742 [Hondaea fermentalgiana]|eukprot:GBG24756.1 Hypothetical Protein FCC1311_009742 [Hondaea fermentalgiana]